MMNSEEIIVSEAIEGEMEKNSEVLEVHFEGKIKRIPISLWEKINGFRREVQDEFFCGTEQIERTKVYHVWPGNNVFFYKGRLICGPDPKGLLLTVISIGLSSWTFAVRVASDLGDHSIIIMISSILTMIVLINLGLISTMDPGIVPRNHNELPVDELEGKSRSKRMMIINGMEVKLKYCRACNIYRPPRSCHCAVCDNCVQNFHHHCPWVGHCIGLRNYRLFLMLLVTAIVFFLFILAFSCKKIQEKLYRDGIGVNFLVRDCPETVALAAFSFAAVCFLGGLCCYHVYLITINQTSYEHFHEKYVSSRNPFDKGIVKNIKEGLLSPQPPSRVNFAADVQSLCPMDSVMSI